LFSAEKIGANVDVPALTQIIGILMFVTLTVTKRP